MYRYRVCIEINQVVMMVMMVDGCDGKQDGRCTLVDTKHILAPSVPEAQPAGLVHCLDDAVV